ncbi:hypothetical protein KI387_041041, partial [Taxus chinensis]
SAGQLGRRGANRPKSRQAVRAAVGTSGRTGREKVNRPKVEKIAKFCFTRFGTLGQKYARDANRPVWRKSVHFGWFGDICPRQFGTSGPKVRGGREPAGLAEIGDRQFGTVGPKVRVGREKPKEPPTNGISPRVFTSNRNKEARIGRSRRFSSGTSGTKVRAGREGREKPKRPKAKKKSQ